MFNPSQTEVREFFFNTYEKHKQKIALDNMEKMALSIMLEHPQYDKYLSNPDKYLNHQWATENNETNPFLHLSMHMSILEQLSINQPLGIKELYQQLCIKFDNEHDAQHQLMDGIAEMIWYSQRNNLPLDVNIYLTNIQNKLK